MPRDLGIDSEHNYGTFRLATEPLVPQPPLNEHPINEVAIPILNEEAAAPRGLWGRLTACFEGWSLKRKVVTTAVAATALTAIVAVPVTLLMMEKPSAVQICLRLPIVGAPYLNATITPYIQSLFTNMSAYFTEFCGGAPVTDQNVIGAAQNALNALYNQIPNEIAFRLARSNTSETFQCAHDLLFYSLYLWDCLAGHGCPGEGTVQDMQWPNWVALYTTKNISITKLREGAAATLVGVCARTVLQPIFDDFGGYSCHSVPGVSELIQHIALDKHILF